MPISPWLKMLPALPTWNFFMFGSSLISTSVRTVFGRVGCSVRISRLKTFAANRALFDFSINVLTFHNMIVSHHPKSGKAGGFHRFVVQQARLVRMAQIRLRRQFCVRAVVLRECLHQRLRINEAHSSLPFSNSALTNTPRSLKTSGYESIQFLQSIRACSGSILNFLTIMLM